MATINPVLGQLLTRRPSGGDRRRCVVAPSVCPAESRQRTNHQRSLRSPGNVRVFACLAHPSPPLRGAERLLVLRPRASSTSPRIATSTPSHGRRADADLSRTSASDIRPESASRPISIDVAAVQARAFFDRGEQPLDRRRAVVAKQRGRARCTTPSSFSPIFAIEAVISRSAPPDRRVRRSAMPCEVALKAYPATRCRPKRSTCHACSNPAQPWRPVVAPGWHAPSTPLPTRRQPCHRVARHATTPPGRPRPARGARQ